MIPEFLETFPEALKENEISLPGAMADVFQKTGRQFVVLIDEWDCLFRTDKENGELQEEYLGFLRSMFKDVQSERFILLAYMTGILPIKKYGTQSALNNFYEYTMVKPGYFAEYVGFTEDEVKNLCEEYQVSFEEMKRWYDGYYFERVGHVYNPKAVVEAFIPNQEVADEFRIAMDDGYWKEIAGALKKSGRLLQDTWNGEEESVAEQIDEVHMDTTSILSYNDENSLSCVLSLAYYSARKYYTVVREMSGRNPSRGYQL